MKTVRIAAIMIVVLAATGAAVVFTGVVAVQEVRVQGLSEPLADKTRQIARQWLDERGTIIRRGALLPILRPHALEDTIAQALPELDDLQVVIDLPHTVTITADRRVPEGIWCRTVEASCTFWDRDGVRWGSVAPSVGPLLLLIRDERSEDVWDDILFSGILSAVDGLGPLGVRVKYVVLPDAEPGGIRISTDQGWDLLLDASGDVEDQLRTLDIFLADKASDTAFSPLYIDLRTLGRVYYR